MQQQTEVEICQELGVRYLNLCNGTATVDVQLHSTDPKSHVHAVINITLHPASGRVRAWPEWYG